MATAIPERRRGARVVARRLLRELHGAGAAALMVAAAVVAGEIVRAQAPAAQVSPVFVAPVVVAAARFRIPVAVLTAVLSVAAYDFVFTTPLYSLAVDDAADLVTLVVLLAVAGLVSGVAARARLAARAAQDAARRSHALHQLAAAALQGAGGPGLLGTAAATLRGLSGRPAVFASLDQGTIRVVAGSGDVHLSSDDQDAARWVARERRHFPAGDPPYFGSSYDFWPTSRDGLVVGVRLWNARRSARLSTEDVEQVLGYVASAQGGRG